MRNKFDKEKFKRITKMIESSGGRNINHVPVDNETHKGDSAIGDYALMPETINELVKSRPVDIDKEEQRRLLQMSGPEKKEYLVKQKPEYQEKLVDAMIDKLAENYGGDELKMNYAYEHGHNLSDDTVSRKYRKSERNKRYLQYDDSPQGMANFAKEKNIYKNTKAYDLLENEPVVPEESQKEAPSFYNKIIRQLTGK